MGVIDSLSAGYRFLGRRFELLIVPLVLDLLLWLAPRFNVAPLASRLADFYMEAGTAAQLPTTGLDLAQMTADMRTMGETTNLLTGLVSGVFLHVPSLMATAVLPMSGRIIAVASGWAALGLWLLCVLAGVWLGVLYLEMLARVLPLGEAAKPETWGELLRRSVRHWRRVLAFVAVLVLLMLAILIPYSLLMTLVLLVAPGLATGLLMLSVGIAFAVMLYLYFVTAAIVLDDTSVRVAIVRSMNLVRTNFLSVLGLVLLTLVISAGLGLLLARAAAWQPWGTLAAIVANAYIGTGLAMALLVFYRTRLLLAAQTAEVSA